MVSSRRCSALDDEDDDDDDEDEEDDACDAKNAARPDADAMHEPTCASMNEGRIMSEHAGH
jgi:hypothetical protein